MSPGAGAPPSERRGGSLGRELALLAVIKLAVCALVLALGFQGISDDDFARVVIAQELAHAPRLDPSGTSWLPLPFWLNGACMMLLGKSLFVARAVAVLSGVASVWLVRIAAGWLIEDRRAAFAGAVIAALIPWSARLGVSTVPELLTAACSLIAIASLATPLAADAGRRRRLYGGAALLVATLSRYEPWFIAAAFAAITALETVRARAAARAAIGSVTLALAGPLSWTLWNRHAHGAAFHFLDRVTSYKQAVDQGAVAERAFSYVFATFRAEPELLLIVLYLVSQAWLQRKRAAVLGPLRSFVRPLAVLLVLFVLLTISSVKGGAPTHHPERALLVLHLTLALIAGVVLVGAVRHRAFGSPLALLAFAAVMIPAVVLTRSWFLFKESFARRSDEVALGAEVARVVPPSERVLVEVTDYGFFAVEAGSQRPWSFVPSAQVDPAHGAPRFTLDELAARAHAERIAFLAAARAEAPPAELVPLACHGAYCLYRVEP